MTAPADLPMAQNRPRAYRGPCSPGPGPAAVPNAVLAADRSGTVRDHAKTMRSWPLLVPAVPAAAGVWSGWVGIAQKTGFGTVPLLPGIWPSLRLDTAVTLPVAVECYAAYALRAWLATEHAISDRTRRFARRSAVFSFALGMAGQVAFHLMDQAQVTSAPWAVTTLVSCLPVLVLGMGTALAHMLREDAAAADRAQPDAPGRATRALPTRSPDEQSGDQPNQSASDRTAAEHRPPGQAAVTLPLRDGNGVAECPAPALRAAGPDIDHARGIARELAGAGRHVSRRALRSRGVEGSNEALNALALRLSAELAIDTAGCSLRLPRFDGHHQGFIPGRMSDHGRHGEEAPAAPFIHSGVQGGDR
jgi:hypothetical protein